MEEQEISLEDLIQGIRKHWKTIVVPAIMGAAIATVFVSMQPRKYESYGLVRMGISGNRQLETIAQIKEIMNTLPMREKIAAALKESDNRDLVDKLAGAISYEDVAGLMKVKAEWNSPQSAQQIASAAINTIVDRHKTIYADSERRLNTMVRYAKEILRPVPISGGVDAFFIEPTKIEILPVMNSSPTQTKRNLKIFAGFFGGMFLGIIVAFFREVKWRRS